MTDLDRPDDRHDEDAARPILDLDVLDGAVIAGRYEVAQIVSLGENTVIVDALDRRAPDPDGHPVTVKLVRPHLAAEPDFLEKFRVLADLSQALTHPNISSVLDWGEIEVGPLDSRESTVYWVVDAFGGGSLRDLMDRGRTLSPGQALVVGLEACRALDAAHQRGLIHTELTPSKMVFGADRRLRIVDFGMARLLAEQTWENASSVPTHVARYASPEQAIGLPVDATTDVYALALVMVEAVTGEVPFSADSTVATLASRVDRLLPVSADLGALAAVLERAARPEAGDRYTAAEFGRALVQAAGKLPRPEPIPILSTGMFDTTSPSMRRPSDPTGGVDRPDEVDEPGASLEDPAAAAELAPDVDLDAVGEPDVDVEGHVEHGEPGIDAPSHVEPGPEAPVDEHDERTGAVDDLATDAGTDAEPVGVDAVDDLVAESDVAVSDDAELAHAVPDGAVPDDAVPDGAELDHAVPDDGVPDAVVAANEPESPASPVDLDDEPLTVPVAAPSSDDLRFTDEVLSTASAVPPAPTAEMPASVVRPAPSTDPAADESTPPPALFDDAPPRRRKGPIVLLVVVLLAGLAGLGYAATLLFQPKSFAVPALAGQPVDRALNQIAGNGWEISYEFERSDSFPTPEQVIRTEPEPGAELEEGEPFLIVRSQGPEFRLLPEVVDRSFDEAAVELTGLGLRVVEAPEREFSETLALGSVVSWQVVGDATLTAGDQILPGETVQLTLSAGPAPRSVPSFAGNTLDEAVAAADQVQLRVVSGAGVFSDDVPEGRVVSQEPAAGAELARDGTITVQLSLGPDVVPLPDLEGLSFTDAQAALDEAGFVIGRLLGTTAGTFVELTIEGDDVAPGTEFPRGTVVDVIFL